MTQPVRVYDQQLNLLYETDNYLSLIFNPKFYEIGSFEFHINQYVEGADYFQKGHLIVLDKRPDKAMLIRHREIALDQNGKVTENWKITGVTLEGVLDQRITIPPSNTDYDRISGPAETVMKHYVRNHLVDPANPNRKIDFVEVAADQKRGEHVEWESRLKNVADEISDIAKQGNLGFVMYADMERGKWIFDVVEPRDVTRDNPDFPPVFFSPDFATIKTQQFVDSHQHYKNAGYVGGQGEGKDRTIVQVGDHLKGIDRAEIFIDARDVGMNENDEENENLPDDEIEEQLKERGRSKLREHETTFFLEAQILTPVHNNRHNEFAMSTPFEYEVDFRLGDVVEVFNKKWNITMNAPITEIREIHEANGFTLEATFGEAQPTLMKKLNDRFNELMGIEQQELPVKLSTERMQQAIDYAEGRVSQEEQERIQQAQENLEASKEYADEESYQAMVNANEYTESYAEKKKISQDVEPLDPEVIWIDTSQTPNVPKVHNGFDWEKISPTEAAEVGAETPEGAQDKSDQAEQNAKSHADIVANQAEKNAIDYTDLREQEIMSDVADKADLDYVDGQLHLKQDDIPVQSEPPVDPSPNDKYFDNTQTPYVLMVYDGTDWVRATPTDAEDVNAYTITEVDTALNAKVSVSEYEVDQNDIVTRFENNESAIEQNEYEITQRVEQTIFNDLEGRVSEAESTITQHANEIELRVAEDGVISAINQSPETISIQAENIELTGAVSVLSDITGDLGTIEAGEILGVYIEGAEIVQNAGSNSTSIHLNDEGLIVKDSDGLDRLAIITDQYEFQGANPSSIFFDPNQTSEFLLGIRHEGYGDAYLGFTNVTEDAVFTIANDGGTIQTTANSVVISKSSWRDHFILRRTGTYDADWEMNIANGNLNIGMRVEDYNANDGYRYLIIRDTGQIYSQYGFYTEGQIVTSAALNIAYNGEDPDDWRYQMYYDGSNGNLEWLSQDTSGDWNRRLTFTGRSSGVDLWGETRIRAGRLIITSGRIVDNLMWDRTSSNSNNARIGYFSGDTSNATFYRVTSAKKYKLDIEIADVDPYKILELEPKSWLDKKEVEDNHGSKEGIGRNYGLIADDVAEVGLQEYVEYDGGEVDSLAYDRLWTLLIPITNDHEEKIKLQQERIEMLEKEVEQLKGA